jgi:hypothetical protein
MTTDTPMVVEINCSTGEETTRPMTAEEIAARDAQTAAWLEQEAARKAEEDRIAALKASAKAKLVSGTPLTEDEAAVITL